MTSAETITLTPTARLARAEKQRRALARKASGELAWQEPQVLPFPVWISQLRDAWFLTTAEPAIPINASQALLLWQSVIDRDVFIGEPRVAEMAAASWRLIHEYLISPPAAWPELLLSQDSRQFRIWARRFATACDERGLIDEWRFAARLPGRITAGEIALPERLRLIGFELPMTPLQQAIVEAAAAAGVQVEREHQDQPSGAIEQLVEDDDELLAAARWARAGIEQRGDERIAIVVPDLGQRLGAVERAFRQVFDPESFALTSRRDEPWHISLGPALAHWPLVADALALLKINPRRISQSDARTALRSPFLGGFETEARARAEALARIHRYRPHELPLGQLLAQLHQTGAERLAGQLRQWQRLVHEQRSPARPSVWIERFQTELTALGFGHGQPLDSREFQALQRFHELLESFSALDLLSERPMHRAEALRSLRERAAEIRFRQHNPGAPIEILGVEEALGARFDALWITGLDHRSWPAPTRRDPFIPGRLQIQAGVPNASAEASLTRARAQLEGLRRTATVIVGSYSPGNDAEQRYPTALLGTIQVDKARAPLDIAPASMEQPLADRQGPPHPGGAVRGGSAALQRQSDCPFRSFAMTRLGADDLTPPRPGLGASDRGQLIHSALERFWSELHDQDSLKALDEQALSTRIAACCSAALADFTERNPLALSPVEQAIEARCLERSLSRWLAIEDRRSTFVVQAPETEVGLELAGLSLSLRIDRIDRLEDGGQLVIDYKTGAAASRGWAPSERLADVQLPAYACAVEPRPAGISFARLKADAMGFDGLAEVDAGIPGVAVIGNIRGRSAFRHVESWPALIDEWREQLDTLASEFREGEAAVAPRDPQVCRRCHLHALCRIHDQHQLLEDDDA